MAPVISSINPNHGPPTGGTAVTITGSGFIGATSVKFGTVPVSSFTLVSDSQITTIAPAGTGSAAVTVATPLGTSNGVTYTYGTVPVITSLTPTSGTAGTSVVINGSGFTGTSSVHFGTASAAFTVLSDGQIQATAPAGTGTVQVTVTTPAGTSNGVAFTYTVLPVITSLTPTSGTAGTSVVINGSGFTGTSSVHFGTASAAFTVLSDGQIQATAPAGTGTVQVTVTTPAGTSNGVAFTYTVLPVITSLTPTSGTAGTSVVINGSGFTGTSSVHFGTASAAFTVLSDGQIQATAPAGTGTVQVTVTTPAGTSNGVAFTYTVLPVITSLTPTSGTAGTSVVINGSGFTGTSSVHFGTASAAFTVLSDGQIQATAPAGTGTVQVTVTTPAGTSNGVAFTYTVLPVITSLTPTSGTAGTSVVINGSGFTGTSSVHFGTASAAFTVLSDGQIQATAPAGTGTVQVTVTTPAGTSNGVAFTYTVLPVITSLTPNQGPTSGGNTVTISGTGLSGATSVLFGTHAATITANTAAQITVTAPAGAAQSVNVTVTTSAGTSNPLPYFYVAAPAVTGLIPTMGPSGGGNTVTIFGSGLALTSAVHFGSAAATNVTVISDSQVTATAPAGTGTVLVTTTTPGGTSTIGLGNAYYTYVALPVISSLSPAQGSVSGGDDVLIRGSNLTYTDAVFFGTAPASFAAVSDTMVVTTSPPGAVGPVTVTVHSPGGTSNGATFQYQP
ncbi:beta strand repeat-containing protein [Kitasatospora cathayae]|uniref:IPT/TIG domain-containing protein n=1 Tax=Kitasatospora cathayae TaxID=3004092 RepID=A0ABY7QEW7_9ACTN|nr:IPT/TIG domain-containing protein [Kitasatospora sp. HUAS 3-15]WBP91292.1 IPT/TIG domain-containing protein [Kitasatospora sp. HUAS 3-15]